MPTCTHCNAPLPKDSIICAYCGARNDIDLGGGKKRLDLRPHEKRTCPVCDIALITVDIGVKLPLYVDHCESCFGLFFDNEELETLIKAKVQPHSNVNYKKLRELNDNPRYVDIVTYRHCPVCDTVMNRTNYAKRSGVIMDVCKEHGIWLDPSELTQILEWSAVTGQTSSQPTQNETPKRTLHNTTPRDTSHGSDIIERFWELFH